MTSIKSLLLTIFTTCCFVGLGQREHLPIQNFTTKDFGSDKAPEVYCTVQDNRGVMYFASGNGVLEYDGFNWTFVSVVPGAYVRSLAVDSSGVVYVGTMGDFGLLKANDEGKVRFVSLLRYVNEDDMFFTDIWNIHATEKFVYFQAQEGLYVFDIENKTVKAVYPDDSFHTSFCVDGEIYLRSRGVGIVKYTGGDQLEKLKGTDFVKDLGVFGLHRLEDDSLLIVTQEIGIWKWKNNQARQLPDPNETPIIELGLFGTQELPDGNIAFLTFVDGMFVMNKSGKILQHYNQDNGLESNEVKHIYLDKEKNLWLSMGNGVALVNYVTPFSYYGEAEGLYGAVWAITKFKGDLYVGTSDGLFRSTSGGKLAFENTNLIGEHVQGFDIANDRLYIATSEGVYSSPDGKSAALETPQSTDANEVRYIESKNLFVVGGLEGILIYDANFREIHRVEASFSKVLGIDIDPFDENLVWLGTIQNGLYKINLGIDSIAVKNYGDADGLLDNVGTPLRYHDSLIFGTKEGLAHFINEEMMKKELTEEELKNPLNYRGMFQDQKFHGYSSSGQFLFLETSDGRDWYCEDNFTIGYYDHEQNEFHKKPFKGVDIGRINTFFFDEERLWVGSSEGLISSTGREKHDYDEPFNALIRSFIINGDSVLFQGAFNTDDYIQREQSDEFFFEIEYEFNSVYFTYCAPYFDHPEKVEYSYMLEGYDDDWSQWSGKTEANFTNLNEGEYTFKAKARNVYDVESEIATFKFTILPPWYRTVWAYMLYGLGFIVVFFVGFRLFSLRLKRRNQWLEGVVEERTKEIREKNTVLAHQKQEIEDSINYAQRIQEAVLPLEKEMKKWLPKSFVLFRPKDIVSGDFYWFIEKEGKLIFICADCTGHGVPGAFMSMIGADRLSIIVGERKILNPGSILSELNKAIKTSLKQDGATGSTRDGMDAAVCTIDLEKNELMYAGANRPLWIVNDGELEEIKATKVAVAGFTPDSQIFEEHIVKLKPGMKFYMTSDGYADQFGGDRGKKLKVKALKQFILDVCNNEFDAQKDELEQNLLDWMSGYEQIDDVCVVGFQPIH